MGSYGNLRRHLLESLRDLGVLGQLAHYRVCLLVPLLLVIQLDQVTYDFRVMLSQIECLPILFQRLSRLLL